VVASPFTRWQPIRANALARINLQTFVSPPPAVTRKPKTIVISGSIEP
jgi:hypothetical protein